jgi:hypothetical protein
MSSSISPPEKNQSVYGLHNKIENALVPKDWQKTENESNHVPSLCRGKL